MCGISAVLDRRLAPDLRETLLRLHAPIRHRGPDGEGFLLHDGAGEPRRTLDAPPAEGAARVGLAFRRLRILDLSLAAAQPMASPDGLLHLAYNGEVYNYRELRRELEARGRRFHSSGDTEVVLAAYEAWGEDCFARFEGMWALVILDRRRGRLVASRDRFGIKPLFLARDGERLLLASEAKQIVAARRTRPEANRARVAAFLRGGLLPARDETFFAGITGCPAGHWLEVPLQGEAPPEPAFHAYWRLADVRAAEPPLPFPAAVAGLRARLESAVESHDASDVPAGALLSGGLDSAAVVGLLAPLAARRQERRPTFSFGFRGRAPAFCELRYVDAMVRRHGLESHETTMDGRWIVENAGRVLHTLEEPLLAPAAFAQHRTFQLVREHGVTVVLDGQAADEVLGGYAYHQRLLLFERLRRGRLGSLLHETDALARHHHRHPFEVLAEFFLRPALARLDRPRLPWLDPAYGAGAPPALDLYGSLPGRSLLDRRLHDDVVRGNVRIILGYADRNAMAHSVEARVPYLDHHLVEFAFAQPDAWKAGGGERKRMLRAVARPLAPPEITERRDRMGFAVPDLLLMAEGVRQAAAQVILDPAFRQSACFEPRVLRALAEGGAPASVEEARVLWRLYTLGMWQRTYGVAL